MRKRRWFYLWQFKTNVINIGYWLINPIFRWNLNSEWSRCVIGVTRMQRFILWAKLEVMNKQTGLDETGVPEVPEVLATSWTGSPEWPLSVLKIQCSSVTKLTTNQILCHSCQVLYHLEIYFSRHMCSMTETLKRALFLLQ